MESLANFNLQEKIPTTFWKSSSHDEIRFFLNEAIKLKSEVSVWIMVGEKKIIVPGIAHELHAEIGTITFNSIEQSHFDILTGSSMVFVYIPGKQKNILFKSILKLNENKKIHVLIPTTLFIHELRKEKRIYIPPEKNIEVVIGNSRGSEIALRKTRLMDISSKGIGLFFELVGDPKMARGDHIFITQIPISSLTLPVNIEICYVNNYLYKIDSRTTLRGFKIGCKFIGQKIDLKKI